MIRLLFLGDPRYDRRIQNFARFFRDNGWRVDIVAGVGQDVVLPSGYKAIPIKYHSGPRRFLSYHHKLLTELRRVPKPDILFACDLYSLRAAAVVKKTAPQTKVWYDAREIYTQLPTVIHKPLARWFWKWFERGGLKETDIVITTGPKDANAILTVHSFLPHSIVVKNMPHRGIGNSGSLDLRKHFGLSTEKKLLVYVGGLQQGRGLEKAITAMMEFRNTAVLILIGDGALRNTLHERVKSSNLQDSVYFYGQASVDNVLPLLSSADVGVSLIERISGSYDLALPSKLFEYLHAGLPVVCSDLEQVKDCFGTKEYIVYVDENNQEEIVDAFKKELTISENSKLRRQIVVTASEEFVFEKDAEKLLTLL